MVRETHPTPDFSVPSNEKVFLLASPLELSPFTWARWGILPCPIPPSRLSKPIPEESPSSASPAPPGRWCPRSFRRSTGRFFSPWGDWQPRFCTSLGSWRTAPLIFLSLPCQSLACSYVQDNHLGIGEPAFQGLLINPRRFRGRRHRPKKTPTSDLPPSPWPITWSSASFPPWGIIPSLEKR